LSGKWVEGGKLEAPLDSPLHIAARLGQHDIAKMLLTRGVGVLRVDGYSSTPLYYAVCKKDKTMALLLLRAGADQEFKKMICRRGVAHTSVLEAAIMKKNLDMTCLLLDHGATSKLHPKPKRRAM
jgi:ankyrin repeat protein